MKSYAKNIHVLLWALLPGLQACTQVSEDKLQGEWRLANEIELPDFILFHSCGRYIVFNDFQGANPALPIIEKGTWRLHPMTKKIVLTEREIVIPYSVFALDYGLEPSVTLRIIELSDKTLIFSRTDEDGYTTQEHYTKVRRIPEIRQTYSGVGSCTKHISLNRPLSRLKLSCEGSMQLVIEDPEGNAVFKKSIEATTQRKNYKILLADLPNAVEITTLTLKITNRYPTTRWKCVIKGY